MPQAQTALLRPPPPDMAPSLLSILRRREIACQGPLHKIGQRSPFLLLPMDIAPPSLARGFVSSFSEGIFHSTRRALLAPFLSIAAREKTVQFPRPLFCPRRESTGTLAGLAWPPTGRRIESHFRVVLSSPFPPGETREGAERGPFSPFSSGFLKFKGGIGPRGVGW